MSIMIDNLRALAAVVDCRSLTKAAAKLYLTQSAISRRIQQLEEDVGGMLFDRAQRPPAVTALGRRVYEQALPILRAVDDLRSLAREDAEPHGTVRLGVSHAVGDVILVDAIERLAADFPNLDVRLRTGWSEGLAQQVTEGELDAAVMLLAPGSKPLAPLMGHAVVSVDAAIVQSRRRPLVPQTVSLAELARQDWILNPVGCGYRATLERVMGKQAGGLHVAIDTHGTEIQLRLVAAGLGLGLVPRSVLRASPHRDEIVIVDAENFSIFLEIWLVHLKEFGNLGRAIDRLAETIADGFDRYGTEREPMWRTA
jgi:DNA-binding transcriptional LysR family regulator